MHVQLSRRVGERSDAEVRRESGCKVAEGHHRGEYHYALIHQLVHRLMSLEQVTELNSTIMVRIYNKFADFGL